MVSGHLQRLAGHRSYLQVHSSYCRGLGKETHQGQATSADLHGTSRAAPKMTTAMMMAHSSTR